MSVVMYQNRMQDIVLGATREVDVVNVHSSWWPTRVKQGVHVLNPSPEKLELARNLSRRLGTYTVYVYEDKPSLKPAPSLTRK